MKNVILSQNNFWILAKVFFSSLIFSVILMPFWIYLSNKLNLIDKPNERKLHTTPKPRSGGLVILLSFMLSLKLFSSFGENIDLLLFSSFIVFLVGFIDDIISINAIWKLIALLLGTFVLAYFGKISTSIFECFYLDIIVTCIWVVGITSAFNALDHMDGLLGGIVLIAALMFFIVSLQTYQYVWSIITMGLIGSMVGYLFFNLPPAKIFMGDGGSFFLGFIVAELSIMGGWSTNAVKASIIPIIILLIPILDLTFVIIKRLVLRETTSLSSIIKHCAKDHLGHRLLKMGFGIKMSLVLIYFVCFNIGIGAVALRNSKSVEAIFMLIFCINVTLLSLLITFYLKRKDK